MHRLITMDGSFELRAETSRSAAFPHAPELLSLLLTSP
jgi:hypothetical protein